MPSITLYPLSNYSFAIKSPQYEQDPSVNARLARLEREFQETGEMRRTVEGVILCHEHGHPHVLLLQVASAFYKLPGDYLREPFKSDSEGLKFVLHQRLGPEEIEAGGGGGGDQSDSTAVEGEEEDGTRKGKGRERGGSGSNHYLEYEEWRVGDLLAKWFRPNFEGFMYPYVPAHISQAKEVKLMHVVHLPQRKVLTVPRNMKLLAVPLFELYDNAVRYGPSLAAVPHLLSKYDFIYED